MSFNTPASHIEMYDGTTAAGELSVPWVPVDAADVETDYEDGQEMLAKHACGNLYSMNGRGSGPNV